ncbi:MAG: glyceraldehyde-3-phosphate dehydrogenase [Bacteroidota bacterium]
MNEKELLIRNQNDTSLKKWREKEMTALELLQIVGELRFDRSIELILFRRAIYDARPSEVLKDHLFAKNYVNKPISVQNSLSLAKAISRIEALAPARIDLGKLGAEWLSERDRYKDVDEFVNHKLRDFIGQDKNSIAPRDVVLYGFGRIGRLAARRIIEMTGRGEQLRLKAIVLRPKLKDTYEEAQKRAALLRKDSVHGKFRGTVDVAADGSELIVNGNRIQLIYAARPEDIDYTEYGIENALVIDNTGVWRDREGLSKHLRPGATQVLLTAPGKDIPNIVHGVNQHELDIEENRVFCAASCTTNAIVPVLKVVDEQLGIERGHIETIHAYTSDQNLLDNFHKKPRRGRGAATNMVLTTTGAAKAVAKVLPQLAGTLTGNAVRVPTPNVSLAIMSLTVRKETTVEALNAMIKEASLHGGIVEQLHYSESTEYVSSHAVGMTHTSVLDAPSTIVAKDGRNITLYAWYDNEFGYTCQVVRLAKYAAKVRRYVYY